MKIESSLKQTYGGVYFFSKPMNPNEIDELDQSEWKEFLDAVRAMGSFIVLLLTYRVRMKIQQKNHAAV